MGQTFVDLSGSLSEMFPFTIGLGPGNSSLTPVASIFLVVHACLIFPEYMSSVIYWENESI
jgi:hypothetical protein